MLLRLTLMFIAMISLITGLNLGLLRSDIRFIGADFDLIQLHGPIMVIGFLGTLISLERAVAFKQVWSFTIPAIFAAGSISILIFSWYQIGIVLFLCAALLLSIISFKLISSRSNLDLIVMALGAVALFFGILLWYLNYNFYEVVYLWMAFLCLTIIGERIQLSKLRKSKTGQTFYYSSAVLLIFLSACFIPFYNIVVYPFAIGLIAAAICLFVFDLALSTIRIKGLTRFIAVALISGYFWLITAGVLLLFYGLQISGSFYDAILHSVFVGFVFSMIFGHAPIIFPAILKTDIQYKKLFYAPLITLHVSLIARIVADINLILPLKKWASVINALAILGFFALIALPLIFKQLNHYKKRVSNVSH